MFCYSVINVSGNNGHPHGWVSRLHSQTMEPGSLMPIPLFPGQEFRLVQLGSNAHPNLILYFQVGLGSHYTSMTARNPFLTMGSGGRGSQGAHFEMRKHPPEVTTTQLSCHLSLTTTLQSRKLSCYYAHLIDKKNRVSKRAHSWKYQNHSLNLSLLPPNVIWKENKQSYPSLLFYLYIFCLLYSSCPEHT